MAQMDMADQLGWCITTKDYLSQLENELLFISKQYGDLLNDLQAAGYAKQGLDTIRGNYQRFESEIDDLLRHLRSDHYDYIDKQCEKIKNTLNVMLKNST